MPTSLGDDATALSQSMLPAPVVEPGFFQEGCGMRIKIPLKRKTVLWAATIPLIVTGLIVASRCSKTQIVQPGTPEVQVVQVEQKDVPIYTEWIGTLEGMVNAEIKAQVTGYLLKQDYSEGTFVRKGQLLFGDRCQTSPGSAIRPTGISRKAEGQLAQADAQLPQANAQVAQAEANQGQDSARRESLRPLAKERRPLPIKNSTMRSKQISPPRL
jgi:membrane fusion protein (multidrug efflux system)